MFRKFFKFTVNAILFLLVIIGIFVVFSFVTFPGNYKIFTVQSGSMEPAIHTGSMIFVKPMNNYYIGDIVTKKTKDPRITVTHRIFSKGEANGQIIFETKGDANSASDGEKFVQNEIIGKMIWVLPFLGYPVNYARTVQGLILLIIVPAVIIIYDEANKIKEEIRKKMDYRRRAKKRDENKLENNDEKQEEKI